MSSRTRTITEIALTVALAAVLNSLKVWQMPQGGNVSLGMLPIIVLGLRRGLGPGLVAGGLYGFVDFLINPFPPVHWIQFGLDYPVAYLAVGLAGVTAGLLARGLAADRQRTVWMSVWAGVAAGSLARYVSHVASGVVFFGSFAPKGQPVLVYSLLYNTYVLVSAVLCGVAAMLVIPALDRVLPSGGRRS